ncbi:YbhB/YbcL family Raf kinase inhibitor-like protein [Acuticoccus sp.]|uniref:YbhB/YbcL family Raf kinase inhibitor-like protein n=1 Tax=Acuticoccus sp. TaxID=1904378 RepID=UPI003B52D8A1
MPTGSSGGTLTREEKERQASSLLRDLLGFDLDLSATVGDLPLSLKQWITIARALLTEPKVLILDESSAALDFDATERLFRKMRELTARGAAVLIVTHRVAELVRIADRATVLRDGVDVGCLEREEITEARILELIAGPAREAAARTFAVPTRQGEAPVLRVEEVRVAPGAAPVSLSLYPGEVIGVTGLDGSGQAAFVRALAGVEPPASGRITVLEDGHAAAIADLSSARAAKVSYVSGDRKREGIFANLSIFENLLLPVYDAYRVGGWLNLTDRRKLTPVFEWEAGKLAVKMGDRNDAIVSLSGGNQQKVLIARAFAEKPAVLVLNDPARGIDIGAKLDLYKNLREYAARGGAVIFLSSEIEEFLDLCTAVHVFRNGTISASFAPPFDGHTILNAMFGRRTDAPMPGGAATPDVDASERPASRRPSVANGRPMPRPLRSSHRAAKPAKVGLLRLAAPDIAQGTMMPARFAEASSVQPRLTWSGVPEGTKSLALAVTDPDLPDELGFGRSFAHWLVYDITPEVGEIAEGSSGTDRMPVGAKELASDFVTFGIPGYAAHYAGPWPPDRPHRYVFTLYALNVPKLELSPEADLPAFSAAVLPATIEQSSFAALYGPAKAPLPS